jgi:putative ABC transport system permease protein
LEGWVEKHLSDLPYFQYQHSIFPTFHIPVHMFPFFFRFMNWFSIRHFRSHPWRVLAVLFGIALGSAVFTSVRLAMHASLDSFTRSMDLISGKADWTVVRTGGRVQERLVAELLVLPGVEAVSPLITTYVSGANHGNDPFLLIGLDPVLNYAFHSWQIEGPTDEAARIWLDLMKKPGSLLPARKLADKQGWLPGNSVVLDHVRQKAPFEIIGILEQKGLSLVEGGQTAIADIASVQEFLGIQGQLDRIDLRMKAWAGEKEIAGIRAFLPPGVSLEEPSETKDSGRRMIRAYELNLSLLSFVSLFVGMFLVYSLVSLNVAARRRELAILSSLGASKRILFAITLSEGLILGICGWLMAVPLGFLLVRYLVEGVSSTINNLFIRVQVETLQYDAWEILLSFFVTLFVSLVAAARPAAGAARVSPREAMVIHEANERSYHSTKKYVVQGLLMIGLALPVAKIPGLPGFPVTGYLAILLLVVGFSLLSLPILHWMGSRLPSLLRRLGGEPAFLAARYVRDAGPRVSISVGALVTAMSLFVALVVMVNSFRETVSLWVNQSLAGDVFLRPKMAGLNHYRDPLPEQVVDAIRSMREVEAAPYHHLELKHGTMPYQFEAVHLEPLLRHGRFLLLEGSMEEIRERLLSGEGLLISEVFSNKSGLTAGGRLTVSTGEVELRLPVLGVFRDYRTRGGIVYMDLRRFQELTGETRWSGARLFFRERNQNLQEAAHRLRSQLLSRVGKEHPIEMASGLELREEILEIFDETFSVTTVLLLIALIVAGLGITTTLTVLVLERIRHLNTLLAVGAGAGQIRSMIFWEAALIVAAGEGVGLVCGFFISYLLIYVVNLQSFGWTFLYRVGWETLLLSVPLIMVTALLAAVPAVRLVLKSSPALVLKEP